MGTDDLSPSEASFLQGVAETPEAPSDALHAGTQIGRYRIERTLGRGGMGIVYVAFDTRLKRNVALKVLPSDIVEEDRRRRFLREARLAAAAIHPSVAAVYEVGEADGHVFLAMELVVGKTLRERLAGGRLEHAEACRIGSAIAAGLASAHARGIVHRDLKPENVMLAEDGVKVLDFGVAKLREEPATTEGTTTAGAETEDGRILGTPGYMSPEQARGAEVDDRTDIFALGVTLYEMLTGKRPFTGATKLDILASITRDSPAAPSTIEPSVPAALDDLVLSCLAKRPNDRPTAREMERRLATIDSELGRRPWIPIAGVAAAITATLAAAWVARQPPAAKTPIFRSPLTADGSVLACPILEASGTRDPGWLGAAAADAVCKRATWLLGGALERTRSPAELLDLPRRVTSDFPADPYTDPETREQSRREAHKASAWIDGAIRASDRRFLVDLHLVSTNGNAGSSHGEGSSMYDAVSAAVHGLEGVAMLPRAGSVIGDVSRWTGVTDIDAAMSLDLASDLETSRDERCARMAERRELLGLSFAVTGCDPSVQPKAIDATSLSTLVLTARFGNGKSTDKSLALRVKRARDAEHGRFARARLAFAEAELVRDDAHEAETWLAASLEDDARDLAAWRALQDRIEEARGDLVPVFRAQRAWVPSEASAWSPPFTTIEDVRYAWRGFELAPRSAVHASRLAFRLAKDGKQDDLRTLATQLSSSEPQLAPAKDFTLACIAVGDVRFGEALRRFDALETNGDDYLFTRATLASLFLAEAIGREHEMADRWAKRFVTSTFDPRVDAGLVAFVCARATEESARDCFAAAAPRFRSPGGAMMLRAGTLTAQGKVREAAEAWRPLLHTSTTRLAVPASIYDLAGEADVAATIDADLDAWPCGGVGCAHARIAVRAQKRGDRERARALSSQVVAAWSLADTEIPVLREMRAMAK